MPWVNANDLECDCVPTTRSCGVVEYPDERCEKYKEGKVRHYSRIIPKKEIIEKLYYEELMTGRQMEAQSIKHFGGHVSRTKLFSWMDIYGLKRRNPHDPIYMERKKLRNLTEF